MVDDGLGCGHQDTRLTVVELVMVIRTSCRAGDGHQDTMLVDEELVMVSRTPG